MKLTCQNPKMDSRVLLNARKLSLGMYGKFEVSNLLERGYARPGHIMGTLWAQNDFGQKTINVAHSKSCA